MSRTKVAISLATSTVLLSSLVSCLPPEIVKKCECPDDSFSCVSGTCKKMCAIDRDCSPAGKAVCGTDQFCIEQCNFSEECDNNQDCLNGFCFVQCNTSNDCAGDEICQDGYCRLVADATCATGNDCATNDGHSYLCYEGKCQLVCNSMLDCKASEDCIDNRCEEVKNPDCTEDQQCDNDQKCIGAVCRKSCQNSLECSGNQNCNNGFCVNVSSSTCQTDGECQSVGQNYHCLEGSCHQPCSTFLDCHGANEICTLGYCFVNNQATCGNDAVCLGADTCHGGQCLSPCGNDSECGEKSCILGYCLTPDCTDSFDCKKYESCQGGLCYLVENRTCNSNSECAAGEGCLAGQCLKTCSNSFQCQDGEFCDIRESESLCRPVTNPQCDSSKKCGDNQHCYEGSCVAKCANSTECAPDQQCQILENKSFCNTLSNAICSNAIPCTNSATCFEGQCRASCTSFTQCAKNEVCQYDLCLPVENAVCNANSDCTGNQAGYDCWEGKCKKPCSKSSECADGERCLNLTGSYLCLSQSECRLDSDCGNNKVCRNSYCRYTCDIASDCPVSQMEEERCMNGRCQDNICIYDQPKNDGAACDDNLSCTVNDTCEQGKCSGTAIANKCSIDGKCYDDGQTKLDDICSVCSSSIPYEWSPAGDMVSSCVEKNGLWQLISCSKSGTISESCPFGCRDLPAPHCIQPSNWGYWDGQTAHPDGITLDWIRGATYDLSCNNGEMIIDTDNLTINCNGQAVNLAATDTILINQDNFYDKNNANGLESYSGQLPAIAAFRFRSIALNNQVTVTCSGSRPLALTSILDATIAGTWNIQCGSLPLTTMVAGIGERAIDQNKSRYEIAGGAGGGYSGTGGDAGLAAYLRKGGKSYGNNHLQPLLGGAPGGKGLGIKDMIYEKAADKIDSLLGIADGCIYSGSASLEPAGCISHTDNTGYNFSSWIANVWNKTADTTPNKVLNSPNGGQGGGALQLVSLGNIIISSYAKIYAYGQGGQSLLDCATRTPEKCDFSLDKSDPNSCTFNGTGLMDYANYPIITSLCRSSSYGGFSCAETISNEGRPWFAWTLQSGGGGGSGGAILFEAQQVNFNNNSQLSVEGGGGGSACYMQGKSWQAKYTYSTETEEYQKYNAEGCVVNESGKKINCPTNVNHYACAAEPAIAAGNCNNNDNLTAQCYGSKAASTFYVNRQPMSNLQGGAGASASINGGQAGAGDMLAGVAYGDCIANGSAKEYDKNMPSTYYHPNDEINFNVIEVYENEKFVNGNHDVSWGGAGGGAGRIRINTPSGKGVNCLGGCNKNARFAPSGSSAAVVYDQDFPENN